MIKQTLLLFLFFTLIVSQADVIPIPQEVQLNGTYTTNILNISNFQVVFTGKTVQLLGGCNQHNGPYVAYSNFSIGIGPFVSTKRFCFIDWDYNYINPLINSVRYTVNGNQVILKNSAGLTTIILTKINTNVINNQIQLPLGQYRTSLTFNLNILVQIGANNAVNILNGCNSQRSNYKAFSNGSITFNRFQSTRMACANDFDFRYTNALIQSVTYVQSGNQIILKNLAGLTTIILTKINTNVINNQIQLPLGQYRTSLTFNLNILVQIGANNAVNILNGCNSQRSNYKAFSNGSITFNRFQSTRMACANDFDFQYTNALIQSVTYVQSGNQIILKNLAGLTTIILTKINTNVITNQIQLPLGQYRTSLTFNLNILVQIGANNTVNILNGCNSQRSNYKAFSNGSITFNRFQSTRMACANDFDFRYTNALIQSVTYVQSGNQIILKNLAGLTTIILTKINTNVINNQIQLPLGQYRTSLTFNLNILVQIGANNAVNILNGCNSQRSNYKAFSNGSITFNRFQSTRMACANDFDFQYTNALIQSVTYVQSGNQIILKNLAGLTTIILTKINTNVITNQIQLPLGQYRTSLTFNLNILVQIGANNTVNILNGCNSQRSNYKAFSNGSITFNRFQSTLRACANDFDFRYTNALIQSVTYVQSGNQIILKNSAGLTTIILTKINTNVINNQIQLPLGQYRTSLTFNLNILVQIGANNAVNILNGCNSQRSNYKAFSNGSITFNRFQSTRMACANDFDFRYTNALIQSVTYVQSGNQIILKNLAGLTTIILTKINTNVINNQIQLPLGQYRTSLTFNLNILVQIGANNAVNILNGCNSQRSNYKAFSNGSITFNRFQSTRMTCANDFDFQYTNALIQSVTYVQSGNQIILKNLAGLTTIILTLSQTIVPTVKYYYQLTASYSIYVGYNIVTQKDTNISALFTFLQQNNNNLRNGNVTAALKKYSTDRNVYQILIKTTLGVYYNVICDYIFSTNSFKIQSTRLLNLNSLAISYDNCLVKDILNLNCKTCVQGYGNFLGRCYKFVLFCKKYEAEECVECQMAELIRGQCYRRLY